MMCTGDLMGGGGGVCPAGDHETALDHHVDGGVCCRVDRGGGSAQRWCAHFNIHERSVWDAPPPTCRGHLGGGVSHDALPVACTGGVAVLPHAVVAGVYLGLRLLQPPSTGDRPPGPLGGGPWVGGRDSLGTTSVAETVPVGCGVAVVLPFTRRLDLFTNTCSSSWNVSFTLLLRISLGGLGLCSSGVSFRSAVPLTPSLLFLHFCVSCSSSSPHVPHSVPCLLSPWTPPCRHWGWEPLGMGGRKGH